MQDVPKHERQTEKEKPRNITPQPPSGNMAGVTKASPINAQSTLRNSDPYYPNMQYSQSKKSSLALQESVKCKRVDQT